MAENTVEKSCRSSRGAFLAPLSLLSSPSFPSSSPGLSPLSRSEIITGISSVYAAGVFSQTPQWLGLLQPAFLGNEK